MNFLPFQVARGSDSALAVSVATTYISLYFGDEQVIFTTNMTTTALSLVIAVERIDNCTYGSVWSSNTPPIGCNYTTTDTQIIYTFFIESGQVLLAGNYTCTAQFNVPGVNHTTSNDGYSIQTTSICGTINSASGNFP